MLIMPRTSPASRGCIVAGRQCSAPAPAVHTGSACSCIAHFSEADMEGFRSTQTGQYLKQRWCWFFAFDGDLGHTYSTCCRQQ